MNSAPASPSVPFFRRRGWRVAVGALATVVAVSGVLRAEQASGGVSDPVTAGIAAYFPDTAPNRSAITARPGLGVVVMNTLQAAGASAAVADYKGAAKRVFGYMAAGYAPSGANGIAPKSLASLQSTASAMITAYPAIDGLFLDEVLNNDTAGCAAPAAFYVSFYQWFKGAYPAKSLILNPGTALCSSFAGSADIYLVFENRLSFYRSAFTAYFALADFDWMRALPNSQVWSIVYGVPVVDMPALMNELADYAGIITVLSDNADHPYSNVPPVAELDLMNARATGIPLPATTTTTTTTTVAATTTTTIAPSTGGVGGAGSGAGSGSGGAVPVVGPSEATTTTTTVAATTTAGPPSPTSTTSTTSTLPVTTTTTRPPAGPAVAPIAPSPLPAAGTAVTNSYPRYRIKYVTKNVRRTRCRTVRSSVTGKKRRVCRKVLVRERVAVRVPLKVKI